MSAISIRPAVEADVPLIYQLICELAEYERLTHALTVTPERIHESMFGQRPAAEALIASYEGEPAGYAVYFHNFSTFSGKSGIYLEDLFVRPAMRGRGLGKAMLTRLAGVALERDCEHVDWVVLDWNESAIKFYESLGAKGMNDWRLFRMTGKALEDMGG